MRTRKTVEWRTSHEEEQLTKEMAKEGYILIYAMGDHCSGKGVFEKREEEVVTN